MFCVFKNLILKKLNRALNIFPAKCNFVGFGLSLKSMESTLILSSMYLSKSSF